MSAEPIIRIKGVRNQFCKQVIHDKLELDVCRGEILGIVGGSGSGKSVLLRTIIGLNHPVAGSIHVMGEDICSATQEELREIQKRWGVMFQNGALFSTLTVLENTEMPLKEYTRLSENMIEEVAELKIFMAGLKQEALHKYPSELSGGMKKRAALARALALDPEIVFLDEPTAGLDPIGAAEFDELVLQLRNDLKLTVVMITHDLDSLYAICDRVAVLLDKKIVVGTIEELLKLGHPWIQEYFGGVRGRQVRDKD